MVDNKGILMIDAGNAFGFRKRNDSFYKDNFTFIDQYEFPNVNLDHYKCISINAFVDQVMLEKNKEKIEQFLAQKKIVVFSGNLYLDWLPGGSTFIPKTINSYLDYVVSIAKPHPIFEGVDPQDMTYNKGVSGFFARGHHPAPEGAEVLLTLPEGEPIVYIDRTTTDGTILSYVGNDLFGYMINSKSSVQISQQLLQWVHDEYEELQKGRVAQ